MGNKTLHEYAPYGVHDAALFRARLNRWSALEYERTRLLNSRVLYLSDVTIQEFYRKNEFFLLVGRDSAIILLR